MDEHECATCNKKFYLDETGTPDKCPSCEWDEYEGEISISLFLKKNEG
tara:strand:- start:235 stop:378 length:144 start_codon:yes stop_codon:yes gene_type:complete